MNELKEHRESACVCVCVCVFARIHGGEERGKKKEKKGNSALSVFTRCDINFALRSTAAMKNCPIISN